ncbi:cytochrome P450 family protein [Corynebacterium deserti GIMN1.010]|uniref:Cytochrome P450 family protein n=1 Tax=Corynebacterium deserti GIMN1.010 TaxID=931089 RepID=A0A0M3QAD1_9CORY|nr:ferredoxin reductase [Corynebacterium deserti]ALC07093.1 cytochrome P450 family protein [Corynebacterium deserti GIMN1.010]
MQVSTSLKVLFARLPFITVDDLDSLDFVRMALMLARRSLNVHWELADIERSTQITMRTLDLKVTKRVEDSDGIISLTLVHPDGRELPKWKPGAHIDLHVGEFNHQYSLSSDCEDRSCYRVGVLREPAGRGDSAAVHDLLVDDSAITDSEHYLSIPGGIGITPILATIKEAERTTKDWALLCGGRSRNSMAFLKELESYGDRAKLVPQDELGHLDLDSALAEVEHVTLIYYCAREGLLQAVEAKSAHWPKGSLRLKRFTPKVIERTGDDQPFEVEFTESDKTVTMGATSPSSIPPRVKAST